MNPSLRRREEKAARSFRLVRASFALAFGALALWLLLAFHARWSLFLGVVLGVAAIFNVIDTIHGPRGRPSSGEGGSASGSRP